MAATTESRLLIVEGRGDRDVVEHLVRRHGLETNFGILDKEGYVPLRKSISVEVKAPGRETLGIMADANDNFAGRWQSIFHALKEVDCDVPDTLSHSGSVFDGPRGLRVGLWLMPNNQGPGELENFVRCMIPPDDPVFPHAMRYIDGIPQNERKFTDGKRIRAYVHAWLATRKKPRPMGTAIQAGDLLHDVPAARSFVDWLRQLFGC